MKKDINRDVTEVSRIVPTTCFILAVALTLTCPTAVCARTACAATSSELNASRYEEVLAHDDGTAESTLAGFPGQKVAQSFQAPPWATHLVAVELFIADDQIVNPNDPQAPTTEPFTLWVWRMGPDELPGPPVNNGYVPFEYAQCPEDTFVRVYFPEPIPLTDQIAFPEGKFFVGVEWEHRLNPYIGIDEDSGGGVTFRWNWTAWEPRDHIAMIRAVVYVGGSTTPQVIYVDASGGGDYSTIHDAVSAAGQRDTLLVAPGTYSGPLNRGITFGGKNLTMISQSGRSETVIDCEGEDRGFFFIDGESEEASVRGFTVRNGFGSGAGIRCVNSWPTIVECAFIDNDGEGYGGGVYCNNAISPSPSFVDCIFADSEASVLGGGAAMDFSDATFEGCTFVGNSAPSGGGIHCGTGSSPSFERCIVAFGEDGGAVDCPGTSVPSFHHCCVYGNAGGDDLCGDQSENISEDPLFCDATMWDYRLRSTSPCLPLGNPWAVPIGALGEGCEASTVLESTWGAIKSMYR